jgi:outer membrane lipoprotein-sorting protein
MSTARRGTAAALAVALAGCVRAPPPDLSRDPAALLSEVRAAQSRVARVRGSARVHVDSPNGRGTVQEMVVAAKPDRLRLETLDFFGNVAAVLVADGERFALYDAQERTFYRGAPTPENVSRLLPVVMPPEMIVTILCGSAPLLAGQPLSVEVDRSQLVLTLAQGDLGQRLAIGEGAAVEASQVRRAPGPGQEGAGGTSGYELRFGDFRRRDGVRFPAEAFLRAGKATVELAWGDDLEIDPPVDDAVFRLEPPRGARVVDLGPARPSPAAPRAGE